MNRFTLYVCIAFATTFAGGSWATRGFPLGFSSETGVAEPPPAVEATFGDDSASEFQRKSRQALTVAPSDKNPRLDAIRLEALQAANAYAISPCDRTVKWNLIAAVTAYTRAWQAQLDCPRPMNTLLFCGSKKLKDAAKTFSTPLDRQVKAALAQAFDHKGIVKADFPDAVRSDMLQFAGSGLWADESPVCLPLMRSASTAK
jgi:hypothetical protein